MAASEQYHYPLWGDYDRLRLQEAGALSRSASQVGHEPEKKGSTESESPLSLLGRQLPSATINAIAASFTFVAWAARIGMS